MGTNSLAHRTTWLRYDFVGGEVGKGGEKGGRKEGAVVQKGVVVQSGEIGRGRGGKVVVQRGQLCKAGMVMKGGTDVQMGGEAVV